MSALGCAATDSHAAPKPANANAQRAQALPPQVSQAASLTHAEQAKKLRSRGAEGLATALATYDALPEGPAKEKQAQLVDKVAAQRYATVSRLFWHTDMEGAKSASQDSGKPILSLRMLGRLDEDYSCANSRLFRTVLYANREVSSYLDSNFTLHWSSEREVPKVTVDYGNGRTLTTTVGGNSAHYILDQEGRPVDVLPGLYSPKRFMEELEPARKLAIRVNKGKKGRAEVKAYHAARAAAEQKSFAKLTKQQQAALGPYRARQLSSEVLRAEMLTVSKMMVEAPLVRLAGLGTATANPPDPLAVQTSVRNVDALDTSSKALIASMAPTDWANAPKRLGSAQLQSLFATLERRVAGDTMINEYGLRPMIARLFIRGGAEDFASLNTVIYNEIFITPSSDAWLGLGKPLEFTGLPLDGLVVTE